MPITLYQLSSSQLQVGLFVGGMAGGLLLGWILRGRRIRKLPASAIQRASASLPKHSSAGITLAKPLNSMLAKTGSRKTNTAGDEWTSTSEGEDDATAAGTGRSRSKSKPALRDCKMVFLVRMDLDMGKGKMAAQCAHAAIGAYEEAMSKRDKSLRSWQRYGQAKIALKVPDQETLIALTERAKNSGLNTYVVRDAGRTQIAAGSLTVAAVGPGPIETIDKITGHLKLL